MTDAQAQLDWFAINVAPIFKRHGYLKEAQIIEQAKSMPVLADQLDVMQRQIFIPPPLEAAIIYAKWGGLDRAQEMLDRALEDETKPPPTDQERIEGLKAYLRSMGRKFTEARLEIAEVRAKTSVTEIGKTQSTPALDKPQ